MPDAVEYCVYCEMPMDGKRAARLYVGDCEPICEFCSENFYTPPPRAHMALARWVALGILGAIAVGLSIVAFIWETSR